MAVSDIGLNIKLKSPRDETKTNYNQNYDQHISALEIKAFELTV